MRLALLFYLLLFGSALAGVGQSVTVSGEIRDKSTGKPLAKVFVSIKRVEGNRIVAFSQTSGAGVFEITKEFDPEECVLEASSLGYTPQTHAIPSDGHPLLIELESRDFALKEVVVSPRKIIQRSDTIAYLVSAFSSAEDRTIGDVLKKMPGVEVLETGEIKYQGQALNKFYIEGSDLLEGRYGLATNNVSHRDVATVEIMENHQPVKALEDVVFSTSPAMNIKLKEDARSRWAGTAKGGGGAPELWLAEVFAMRFKAKTQSLNTYKGNNTGNEALEMNVFFPSGDFLSEANHLLPDYIQVAPSLAGDIGRSRSAFNQTNSLTAHNLVKVGKELDLLSEFTGSFDRRESEYVSQTTYFLGESQVLVEDKTEHASDLRKTFSGKLRLKANQKQRYVNNEFTVNYDRQDPLIDILGSYPSTQRAGIEHWRIGNHFDLLRRSGDQIFLFRSGNEWAAHPQSLQITGNDRPPVSENIRLNSFYSDNSLQYSLLIGNIRVEAPAKLLYQHKTTENEWDNDAANQLTTNKLKLSLAPSAHYDAGDALRLSLSGLVFYQALSVDNRAHAFYGANPRFSVHWTASPLLQMAASLAYSNDLPDENLLYHGTLLNDYRHQTAGSLDFSTGESLTLSYNADYKDVLKTLFANLWVTASRKRHTKISDQNFEGDYIITHYYPVHYTTNRFSVSASFSKGVGAIRGTAAFSPLFVHTQSVTMRNGRIIPYSSDACFLKGRIHSTPAAKCHLTYEATYTYSKNRMENNRHYFSSTRLSESLQAAYSLLKSLQISYKLDHYCNELSPAHYKNFLFSNIALSYLPTARWELSCAVKNIFDEKHYSYFIENELNTLFRSYSIRPRNVLFSVAYRF